MGLMLRMVTAMLSLIVLVFGVLFALIMMISWYFGWFTGWLVIIPLGLTITLLLFQWLAGPHILRLIYKIKWIGLDGLQPELAYFIRETCEQYRIALPRVGIVPDSNPNAFCFGWTRNKAFLVLTEGIFKYCDLNEQKAVIGHELGHIAHNDFVVMTIIGGLPLIFYVIAITLLRSRGGGGRAGGIIILIGAISYLVYILTQFVALLISRYREYYADEFSAKTTNNPNLLASALVKIAYGLAVEGKGDRSDRFHQKFENTLMIFNAKSARSLAVNASTATHGVLSKSNIERAMAWDLWNPWAVFLELCITHPLPAKRILTLSRLAESQGLQPFIKFELKKPECYWDDFFCNIFARASWSVAFIIGFLSAYYINNILLGIGIGFVTAGLALFLYWKFYRYPTNFHDTIVTDLLADPKANPIKGKPVRLHGKIIGRGIPGLFWSEDLKLDDGHGLILLDYHQISKIIDFFIGLFRTQQIIGEEVVIEGWYRRYIVPYVEIYKMYLRDRVRKTWTAGAKVACSILIIILGLIVIFIAIYLLPFNIYI